MKRILGLDPGLATLGFAIVEFGEQEMNKAQIIDFGVISTSADDQLSERLLQLAKDLKEIIVTYKPTKAVVEELFFGSNTKTALQVAHARGVLLYSLELAQVPFSVLTPNQLKRDITGDGRADKTQIQQMLQRIFSLPQIPQPDDAADALALAYCGGLAQDALLAK